LNNGRYNSEDKGDEAGQDIPAVAYVRMSTDHQKYSTENQLGLVTVWCRSFDHVMCSKGEQLWAQEEQTNFAKMRCGSR